MERIRTAEAKLYAYEILQIQRVQTWIDSCGLGEGLQLISLLGDPGLFYTLYFPIICGLSWTSGIRFLGTGIFCSWLNQVLKWLLFGERPFWYIHERSRPRIANLDPWTLKQNPMTCETGPGVPSGHAMINMVIWLVMADTFATKLLERQLQEGSLLRAASRLSLWVFFVAMQMLISVSRVYNLNHFPHQCLLGLFFGMLVIKLVYENSHWAESHTPLKSFACAFLIHISALAIHRVLSILDLNPDWSIEKAIRYCDQQSWIFVDSTPFFSMSRYSGSALGLAFGITLCDQTKRLDCELSGQIIRMTFGFVAGCINMLFHYMVPKSHSLSCYCVEYLFNVIYVTAVLITVPHFSQMLEIRRTKNKAL